MRLDAAAKARLVDHLGEEVSRLGVLLDTLESDVRRRAPASAPPTSSPTSATPATSPPWDLTDAIDRGDTADRARPCSHRMLGGGRHPLQVTASLHGHYQRMLRLDGSGVTSEAEAAELLGIKGSTFPARKALDADPARSAPTGSSEFIGLLADADLDLRGAKAWPPELVVEVLVARLASRTPTDGAPAAGR